MPLTHKPDVIYGTTICCVRRHGQVAMAGDGQMTLGNTIVKAGTRKVRKIFGGKVMVGFAGATADAMTLLDLFEKKLESASGNLLRAAVELTKTWRTDRTLARLEAMIIAADSKDMVLISGAGDVIEPENDLVAIGSGGPYAQAAARALLLGSDWDAERIATEAVRIASEICIYTDDCIVTEVLS